MNIDELTLGQIKDLRNLIGSKSTTDKATFFEVGKKYMIRTVTHIDVGECIGIRDNEVMLTKASWIADTGRYHNCLANGTFSEVEPYPDGINPVVNKGAVVDYCEWPHSLPREQIPQQGN